MGTSTQNPLGWGLVDEAALDETAVRAAQSMDRTKSLRVSLFMVFSFVVSSLKPLRLRCRRVHRGRGNDMPGREECQYYESAQKVSCLPKNA
jgi:hypothetical protein